MFDHSGSFVGLLIAASNRIRSERKIANSTKNFERAIIVVQSSGSQLLLNNIFKTVSVQIACVT
jgi:hypothetical protein